jgi:hypothetical protein
MDEIANLRKSPKELMNFLMSGGSDSSSLGLALRDSNDELYSRLRKLAGTDLRGTSTRELAQMLEGGVSADLIEQTRKDLKDGKISEGDAANRLGLHYLRGKGGELEAEQEDNEVTVLREASKAMTAAAETFKAIKEEL